METPILFPQPKQVRLSTERLQLNDPLTVSGVGQSPLFHYAIEVLNKALQDLGHGGCRADSHGTMQFSVAASEEVNEQGYAIGIARDGITVTAPSDLGILYAVQTFRQLLSCESGAVSIPVGTIIDEPDFAHRGVFIEDKWGMDLMTLDDWKELIDYLASLKCNILGVGVYGCWCVQFDGNITEFLTVPLKDYPDLATPKTLPYYSPSAGWQAKSYLPTMFEQDFFGEVVAYGKSRGIIVRPHFNSLGHNTLIPRHYPEVSAKTVDGEPVGYSFCTSSEATYEMLFRIYDRIIDDYLAPNGIDYFHVGLDEVWPQIGADERDPHRVVPCWCECEDCRKQTPEQRVTAHALRIIEHLVEKGINHISMWNDQFARHMDIIETFAAELKSRGLTDKVIVHWWWYGVPAPETIRPELGLRNWVTPMTGYFFWSMYRSHIQNIFEMCRLGATQGAAGAESYSAHDRGFHREFHCLAEYAWRNDAGSLDEFRDKYARYVFGPAADEGRQAFAHLEALTEPGDGLNFANACHYYWTSYVRASAPYPRDYPGERFRALLADREKSISTLDELIAHAAAAREGFARIAARTNTSSLPDTVANYAAEAHRIEATLIEFRELLDLYAMYAGAGSDSERLSVAGRIENHLLPLHDAMLTDLEAVKSAANLPVFLRELAFMRRALLGMKNAIRTGIAAGEPPTAEAVFLRQTSIPAA